MVIKISSLYWIIKNDKILLIKKKTGPYDGLLDLPGGTIEFNEKPFDALKREFIEETGINITKYELFDANSVSLIWNYQEMKVNVHHIGIFYKILSYENNIKKHLKIDEKNDDSLGAEFYDISKLKRQELSDIAILELEKMEYKLKWGGNYEGNYLQ